MNNKVYDIENKLVQMTMVVKLQQLRRESISIDYHMLEDYVSECLWKMKAPRSISTAVNQILSVKGDDIVRYLAKRAVTDSGKLGLDDFADVIGGN